MGSLSTQSSSLPAIQSECLKLLTGIFDIPKAASYMVDRRSNLCFVKSYCVQPCMQRDYLERFQEYDPLHPNNLADKEAPVRLSSEAVSLNHRMDNPYYTEFFNRWGILDAVEIYLHSDGCIVAGFSLFLEKPRDELSNADMKKLESLQSFMQFSLEASLESPQQRNLGTICDNFNLTAKERIVVEQVLQGSPNKRIATDLSCSLPTVKTHLQNIFHKMNVNSKAEVISFFYSQKYH